MPSKYRDTPFVDIDAGHYHTCALTLWGGAACWGADGDPDTAGIQAALSSGILVNFGQADPQPAATTSRAPLHLTNICREGRDLRAQRGDGTVTIYWREVTWARGYTYEMEASDGSSRYGAQVPIHHSDLNWDAWHGDYNVVIDGLSNEGVNYTFRVYPTTDYNGEGAVGTPTCSASARPRGTPSQPTGFTVTPGDGSVTLDWTPTEDCGGGPCPATTRYHCVKQGGICPTTLAKEWQYQIQEVEREFFNLWRWTGAGPYGSSAGIGGLKNGQKYKIQVRPVLRGNYPYPARYQSLERFGPATEVLCFTASNGGSAGPCGTESPAAAPGNNADNAPATGLPSIYGADYVGGELSASTHDINDENGMPSASEFAYQWLRHRDGNDTDISGANAASYEPTLGDLGARIKVRVSFTDNAGNAESLISPASETITMTPPSGVQVSASGSTVTVTWNSVTNATSYQYRYTVGGAVTGPTEVPVAGTTLTLTGLDLTKTHSLEIYALYYNSWSLPSLPAVLDGTSPQQTPTVSLSADSSVNEGDEATVTATLSATLESDVTIPLTLSDGTAEDGDYGTLASITITAGQTTGAGKIAANWDSDHDADTFTVALDGDNLPSPVTAGDAGSVSITINEVAVPAEVTNITVNHNGNNLSVSWDPAARATGYDITYYGNSVNARGAWNHAGTTLTITCDVRDGHENQNCVNGNDPFRVGIRAKNAHGESDWRNSPNISP